MHACMLAKIQPLCPWGCREAVRTALSALTLEADGVDGAAIYIYGEAWDFGEMANNQVGRCCLHGRMRGVQS